MNKELIDKRVNTFKKLFPNFKISKKGNFFAEIGEQIVENKTITFNGRNVTKGLLNKIGTKRSYDKKNYPLVLLISPSGKLMGKSFSKKMFKNFTLKDINNIKYYSQSITDSDREKVKEVFFIGRKFDYLKDLEYMWHYRCMQNFNSFREFKNHIGYDFISSDILKGIFKKFEDHEDILSFLITDDSKVNVISLLTKGDKKTLNILSDTIRMSRNLELPFQIPYGVNKLQEKHDEFVLIQNQKRIDHFSNKIVYDVIPSADFVKFWEENGLIVKPLDTPRKMYLQGLKQSHCIGSYSDYLNKYAFYTIEFENKEYDIMLLPDGKISQFYGKFNCKTPFFLDKIVKQGDISYQFTIKLKKGADLTDYPFSSNTKTESLGEVEGIFNPDMPF